MIQFASTVDSLCYHLIGELLKTIVKTCRRTMQYFPCRVFPTAMFHLVVRKTPPFPTETTSHCSAPQELPHQEVQFVAELPLEITKIFPVFWCRMDQVLLKLWAGVGLFCKLRFFYIHLFKHIQESKLLQSPQAQQKCLLYCFVLIAVMFKSSHQKMVHQNGGNFF